MRSIWELPAAVPSWELSHRKDWKWWKNCPFQQLRVYAAAQNLFTFTGYKGMDPENGRALNDKEPWVTGVDVGNYPQPRTYMVGVNVKF